MKKTINYMGRNIHATMLELLGLEEMANDKEILAMIEDGEKFTSDRIDVLDKSKMSVILDSSMYVIAKVDFFTASDDKEVEEFIMSSLGFIILDMFESKNIRYRPVIGYAVNKTFYMVFDMKNYKDEVLDIQTMSSNISSMATNLYFRQLDDVNDKLRFIFSCDEELSMHIDKLSNAGIPFENIINDVKEEMRNCVFSTRCFNYERETIADFFKLRQRLSKDKGEFCVKRDGEWDIREINLDSSVKMEWLKAYFKKMQ